MPWFHKHDWSKWTMSHDDDGYVIQFRRCHGCGKYVIQYVHG